MALLFRSFLLWAIVCVVCSTPQYSYAQDTQVKFVYISRLPNIQNRDDQSNYIELASLLQQLRKENNQVLFLFGGNSLGPSPLSSFDKGAHIIGLLNLLEPAVMAVARRDFIHKEDELTLRSMEAAFPFICANIADPLLPTKGLDGIEKTQIITIDNHKIGFIALASPDLGTTYILHRASVTGGFNLLPQLAAELRSKKVELIVAMADFIPENPEKLLAESGVDILIVTTGSINKADIFGNKVYARQGKTPEALIIDVAFHNTPQGTTPSSNSWTLKTPYFIPLKGMPDNQKMKETVHDYTKSLALLLNIPLATTTEPIDTRTEQVRSGENAFGNLVADALRDYYEADIAIINSGGIRGNQIYPAHTVLTRQDILAELPLHDESILLEVTGDIILQTLEYGVNTTKDNKGRFPQVSGITFTYDPNAPAGKKIISANINGTPINPKAKYSLATILFLVKNGDGLTTFNNCPPLPTRMPEQSLAEIVRAYINKKMIIAPVIEQRIAISTQIDEN